jgi:alpha-glucosidase
MRPMFLEYPSENALQTNETEFMFGNDLLIAPKVDEKVGPYDVALPTGSSWYDFWTGKTVTGTTQSLDPPLDALPVFVRAGAILTEQPVVQSTSEVPKGPLQIMVYPGTNCQGSLYQDDGNTLAYQRGDFLRMQFTCESSPESVKVNFSSVHAQYKPWWNSMQVTVYGISSKPRDVQLDGKAVQGWRFDERTFSVVTELPAAASGEIVVRR